MNDVMTMSPFINIDDKENAGRRRNLTHFQDYLGEYTATELIKVFGEPVFKDSEGDFGDGKTKLEWCIKFDYEDPDGDWHGGVFFIYDWKNYRMDELDLYNTKVNWHIGGRGLSYDAIRCFKDELQFLMEGE